MDKTTTRQNQTLDAEIKLATLLIRHGLPDEARFVLDRAAEKITGNPDAHTVLYQLGVVLVSMNEFDRARTHFQQILDMPKPPQKLDTTRKAIHNLHNIRSLRSEHR